MSFFALVFLCVYSIFEELCKVVEFSYEKYGGFSEMFAFFGLVLIKFKTKKRPEICRVIEFFILELFRTVLKMANLKSNSWSCLPLRSISTVGHLAINSTTAVASKAGFALASAATAMVEFMAKWSNMCPPVVVKTRLYIVHIPMLIPKNGSQ